MKPFKKGQKVYHIKAREVLEVVRDNGGVKVVVKDKNGIELSVLREYLKPTEGDNHENQEIR